MDFDKLEDIPSLKKGWVRLVHRCISNTGCIESIKADGLIFNRVAAGCRSSQRGGNYNRVTAMASVYDEDSFWQSLKQDTFEIFDNAKYADAKLVFDMPLKEFVFLQACGKLAKGKIDSKYLVGCIPNINGSNPNLHCPVTEIARAEQISRHNPPSLVEPNDVTEMIKTLLQNCDSEKKVKRMKIISERMIREKALLEEAFEERKKTPIFTKNNQATR